MATNTKPFICIIDYGSGNLRSAAKSFERVIADEALNFDVKISNDPEDILKAERIVLPGQGAFGDCMNGLSAITGMVEALTDVVQQKGSPFLGICVGMQLLATRGHEHGVHAGLNWISGEVVPMQIKSTDLKIPHMGWNTLSPASTGEQDNKHFVLRSAESSSHYYFVHSFVFESEYDHHVLALTHYEKPFTAIVGRDNIIGVQFHPEKSQATGLKLISDFLHWRP